jgi:hypothetical protein
MELHLKVIGTLLVGLSFVHAIFPKYFNWKNELSSLSLINSQMMKVHTFFIAFVVFLIGALCLSSSELLVSTELGKRVSLGLAIFWGVRFVFQILIYSPKLWRGKTFETIVHILFTLFWLYMTFVFGKIYLG